MESAARQPRTSRRRSRPGPPAEPVDYDTLDDNQKKRLFDKGMRSCVWHLEQSAKTRSQLADKLRVKAIPDQIIEQVLDRLEQIGYIDDRLFTETFVATKVVNGKQGARKVRQDLLHKGVDRDLVDEAVATIDPDTEYANALSLARKKAATTTKLEPRKRQARIQGLLARRGYSPHVVYGATREALNDSDIDETPPDLD